MRLSRVGRRQSITFLKISSSVGLYARVLMVFLLDKEARPSPKGMKVRYFEFYLFDHLRSADRPLIISLLLNIHFSRIFKSSMTLIDDSCGLIS